MNHLWPWLISGPCWEAAGSCKSCKQGPSVVWSTPAANWTSYLQKPARTKAPAMMTNVWKVSVYMRAARPPGDTQIHSVIHPSISYSCFLLHSGLRGSTGTYTSWHRAKAGNLCRRIENGPPQLRNQTLSLFAVRWRRWALRHSAHSAKPSDLKLSWGTKFTSTMYMECFSSQYTPEKLEKSILCFLQWLSNGATSIPLWCHKGLGLCSTDYLPDFLLLISPYNPVKGDNSLGWSWLNLNSITRGYKQRVKHAVYLDQAFFM